ncbi:MAG: tryptophan synthase subunit alpha [Deltaproteobacteria bacterium]|nr:tryptophan synthase subunit alpha [Deltaproteobacteria bacterium]
MPKFDWNLRAKAESISLMGHVIADFPSPAVARSMIETMVEAGVKVIEIQIPFSEPMADGALFLAANHKAIAQGVDYQASLALLREMSAAYPHVRFLFMSYLNVIYQRGYQEFVTDAVEHGATGVIVPDLPVEHAAALELAGAATGFANVRVIPPNVTEGRLPEICRDARGLIYAVARAGVTGAKSDFTPVGDFVRRIRAFTQVPIAVGFGVRGAEDVRQLRGIADLAVIGTASLQAFQEKGISGVKTLWQELKAAV